MGAPTTQTSPRRKPPRGAAPGVRLLGGVPEAVSAGLCDGYSDNADEPSPQAAPRRSAEAAAARRRVPKTALELTSASRSQLNARAGQTARCAAALSGLAVGERLRPGWAAAFAAEGQHRAGERWRLLAPARWAQDARLSGSRGGRGRLGEATNAGSPETPSRDEGGAAPVGQLRGGSPDTVSAGHCEGAPTSRVPASVCSR